MTVSEPAQGADDVRTDLLSYFDPHELEALTAIVVGWGNGESEAQEGLGSLLSLFDQYGIGFDGTRSLASRVSIAVRALHIDGEV